MGAINYYTSDYITIGYNCNNIDYEDDFWDIDITVSYEMVKNLLDKYRFYYYRVEIRPGYYEGFSIDIENNFGYCYNDYLDKRDAQKEITQIKNFLRECITEYGLTVVYPGWCTSYLTESESLKELDEAIKDMRITAYNIPTWYTLKLANEV